MGAGITGKKLPPGGSWGSGKTGGARLAGLVEMWRGISITLEGDDDIVEGDAPMTLL